MSAFWGLAARSSQLDPRHPSADLELLKVELLKVQFFKQTDCPGASTYVVALHRRLDSGGLAGRRCTHVCCNSTFPGTVPL